MTATKVGVKGAKKVMEGAGKKMRAGAKTADKIQDSKRFQNISAAKEKIDQQRQMAEQQKQQQQQRASEMARAKASTGDGAFGKAWMALKGETFHPSIMAHLEERTPKRGIAQIAPRPTAFPDKNNNIVSEPVNIEANRGPPDVDAQGFTSLPQQQSDRIREGDMPVGKPKKVAVGGEKPTLGNVNEEMFFNRGHLRIREGGRLQEDEIEEAREIMLEHARELVGPNGRYIPGAPTAISVVTHQLDEIREAPDGSTGDTIVGTIRPHDDDTGQPQLHTVMFRGSNQPMDHAWRRRFNVQKVYDSTHRAKKMRADKNKKKKSVDSIAYFSDVLVKDRKSPEAMRHKREYDAAYNKRPDQVKYREELNRERRRRGIYGSHDHMDVSHTQGGKLTLEPEHSNRARHFKDKGTLRVVKSMKDDLELLRNLMQGPMDEQDKKIAEATIAMIEEREEEEDEDDKKLSRPLFGGSHMFL